MQPLAETLAISGNQAVYADLKKLLEEGSAIAFLGAGRCIRFGRKRAPTHRGQSENL